jgi:hypothetical protein
MEFVFDSGEGTEDEIGGVGHYGSAARGNPVFGLQVEEAGEEFADGDGGLEIGETFREGGGEIYRSVFVLREVGMVEAKKRFRIWDKEAAASSVGETMLAAAR